MFSQTIIVLKFTCLCAEPTKGVCFLNKRLQLASGANRTFWVCQSTSQFELDYVYCCLPLTKVEKIGSRRCPYLQVQFQNQTNFGVYMPACKANQLASQWSKLHLSRTSVTQSVRARLPLLLCAKSNLSCSAGYYSLGRDLSTLLSSQRCVFTKSCLVKKKLFLMTFLRSILSQICVLNLI